MSQAASGTFESNLGEETQSRKSCRKGRLNWSASEIIAMVAGFVIFWPFGLLALFVKMKNGEMWKGATEGAAPWAGWKMPCPINGARRVTVLPRQAMPLSMTTSVRSLPALRKSGASWTRSRRLPRTSGAPAQGQGPDEFDRFMAERNAPPPSEPPTT